MPVNKYDAENRMISAPGAGYVGACPERSRRNAFGRRIRKSFGGTSLDYIYDQQGHPITILNKFGQWYRGEVFAGDMHLATYASGTYFPYTDWMGTERVRTDAWGNVQQYCWWGEFGDSQGCSTSYPYTAPTGVSPHTYAGYEYDPETQLHHTGFRYYNPRLGRFMTTDPYDGSMDLSNPQSLNRYAYVLGDPTNLYDPSGLGDCTLDNIFISCNDILELVRIGSAYRVPREGWFYDPVENCYYKTVSINGDPSREYDCATNVAFVSDKQGGGGKKPEANVSNGIPTKEQCLQQFYESPAGKAAEFGSVLQLVPGWGNDPGKSLIEWVVSPLLKLGTLAQLAKPSVSYSVTKGVPTVSASKFPNLAARSTLRTLVEHAPLAITVATAGDIQAHANCRNLNKDAMELPD